MSYEKTKVLLVQQPFGDFYIASIPASKLVKVTHTIPAEYFDGQLDGVQRAKNQKRIENISRFCLTENPLFPNTIILAANIKQSGDVVDEEDQWRIEGDFLIIPASVEAASIVDGQHRIQGMKKALSDGMDDFDLVCAIYMDLPTPKQAEVFATINFNQQKVDKSLAYQLFGYDLDASEREYWSPDTLAISITRLLGKQSSSPLKNHIGVGVKESKLLFETVSEEQEYYTDPWKVSTSTMVGGISSLISKDPIRDRYAIHKRRLFKKDRSVLELGEKNTPPLRHLYLSFKDETIYNVIESFFCSVEKNLWKSSETILRKTIGIQALFDILGAIIERIDFSSGKLPEKDYLIEQFDRFLLRVDVEAIDSIGKNYSGSGKVAVRNKIRDQLGF